MRATRVAIALLVVAVTLTCSGADNLEVGSSGRAVIPAGSVIEQLLGDLEFAGFDSIEISQSEEFRNQGYTEDQIDSVRVVSMTLTIAAPDGGTFEFLDSIAFTVEAAGLPPLEIARLDPVPADASVLELEVDSDAELRPYAVADVMTVTSTAVGRRPGDDTTVDAELLLDVDVNVSGAACSAARR